MNITTLVERQGDWRAGDPQDPTFARAFLCELVARGDLDQAAADRALEAQQRSHHRIDTVLTELGLLSVPRLQAALAAILGLSTITAADMPYPAVEVPGVATNFFARHRLVPLSCEPHELRVATADAFAQDTFRSLAFLIDRSVVVVLASPGDIDRALAASGVTATAKADVQKDGFVNDDDLQRLKDVASEAPIVRFVGRMIANAVSDRASDIHIEPMVDALRVRYRIDGVVSEVERVPPDMQAGVVSRIKILARLNIAERRLPQDGRAKFVVGGRELDLRISVTPVLHGESVVIRILDRQDIDFSLSSLGFEGATATAFENLLKLPHGIILVTGPTGSGKTTTLYSALRLLNSVDRTIFSVEDPIEYQMPGINQMQIKPGIGLDFAHCLRSILRQDPDVIMVGEMRDTETVRVAIQASLTGHLVLSTLHTNSAAASITRLLDMGAEDYLLSSTLQAVMAQRLVRRLCTCAAAAGDGGASVLELAEKAGVSPSVPPRAMEPVGCPSCSHTGYRGRMALSELLVLDASMRSMIKSGLQDSTLEAEGRRKGMQTLYECGLAKVLAGETSLDEVLRVTGSSYGAVSL